MFDDAKEDEYESFPCPECGGITEKVDGVWICYNCDWEAKEEVK